MLNNTIPLIFFNTFVRYCVLIKVLDQFIIALANITAKVSYTSEVYH